MSFALRMPSVAWEAIPLTVDPSQIAWGWFKTPQTPNAVTVQIPVETWQSTPTHPITIRQLASATGITVLLGWTYCGQYYPLDERLVTYLDAPLSPTPHGVDPSIILWSGDVATMPMNSPMAQVPGIAAADFGDDPDALFDAINTFWLNIQGLEADIRRSRGQLEQIARKLSSLNRDLSPEEAIAADNADKKDWQDARRWLRDSSSVLLKAIKQIDVGVVSGAGLRHRFADFHRQYVVPRIPVAGLKQMAVDFEMHQRLAKNLLNEAQSALSKGGTDGERRANAVLHRIAGKLRQRRNNARNSNA